MEPPLAYTAESGHEGVVQMLLKQAKDSRNFEDSLRGKPRLLMLLGMAVKEWLKRSWAEPMLAPAQWILWIGYHLLGLARMSM